ncbi:MAG: pitrilysin family protein [Propionicimonas sp.]|uniref:M16 family metallopeptidase n=1 Tax=Propionicimonas sp. TaxID=1955623 RepID=UPI003D149279
MPDELNYPIHQRTLGNGLRVVVSPDHSVPLAALNIWYDVGSRDERPGEYGWAHLFEHLMFSGSEHVATGEHLNSLQALGGSVNATTWFDRTNYFETLPVGALDLALWMEADRLATLPDHLTDASVETQREVVKEEKRQRYDNVPYGDAMPALVELVFGPDHPYGHTTIGSMADIDAATVERAANFFRNHYRPDNAVLTIVGDITPKDAFKRVEKAFGRIPSWNPRVRPATVPLPPLSEVVRREVRGRVPAAASYFAWRLPQRDTWGFDACELALSVLGGGQTSRLHQELVRNQQVAAGVGASAMPLIGGTSFGVAQVRALPGADGTEAAEAALAEVARLAEEGPTAAELARAKAQYAREWLTELARFDSRADLLGAYATLHGDPERVNQRLAEVDAISIDQVVDAASAFLEPGQRAQLDYRQEASDAEK